MVSSPDESRMANKERAKPSSMDPGQDIRTKTGGAYIPPAKLRLMQQNISDKNSEAYQRLAWESLKKSINGLINKVNVSNIAFIVKELFAINLIRGRGLLCRSILRAQQSSPTFTHVYAALIAVTNTKFPKVGELLLKRLIVQFRRSFQRNDKSNCINSTRFIAHLFNQNVAHEILALEILVLLLENATNDSVEVAIAFLKECGAKLEEVSRQGAAGIFERLRTILHDGELNKRVQYMIEVMYAIRKDKFKDHPSIMQELDLIEEDEQFTHLMTLEDDYETEDRLNVFKLDPDFQTNEAKYDEIKQSILDVGDDDDDDDSDESGSDDDDEDSSDEANEEGATTTIIDNTETNLINLRKTIYLTIQSSLDFEECAHKLLKLDIKPPQYAELCNMIVDCCAQQRTYIKFFGLLAQRFCQINPEYVEPFVEILKNCYDTIHRFETCKLRNVAKIFAHLLYTDSIPWTVLSHIKLNENDTSSSSRVFIKILFQQLAESMGLVRLNQRIKDPTLDEAFIGLFPRDNPEYTRFAINFFTSIGLGGLTDDLREHLKTASSQKLPLLQENLQKLKQEDDSTSTSSSSDSSDNSSDSDSSDDSSDSSSDSSTSNNSDSSSDEDSDDTSHKRKHRSIREQRPSKYRGERENHRKEERHKLRDTNKHKYDMSRDYSNSDRHKRYPNDKKDTDKYRLKERNRENDKDRSHRHHHRSNEEKHIDDVKKNLKRADRDESSDDKKHSKIRKIRSEIRSDDHSTQHHRK